MILEHGRNTKPLLIHIQHQVLNNDLINRKVPIEVLIMQQLRSQMDLLLILQDLRDVDEERQVVHVVAVDLLLHGLDLCQQGVGDLLQLLDGADSNDAVSAELVLDQAGNHVLAVVDDVAD